VCLLPPIVVELRPARDAMYVGKHFLLRKRRELFEIQPPLGFHESRDGERPLRDVNARDRAIMQHGPVFGLFADLGDSFASARIWLWTMCSSFITHHSVSVNHADASMRGVEKLGESLPECAALRDPRSTFQNGQPFRLLMRSIAFPAASRTSGFLSFKRTLSGSRARSSPISPRLLAARILISGSFVTQRRNEGPTEAEPIFTRASDALHRTPLLWSSDPRGGAPPH